MSSEAEPHSSTLTSLHLRHSLFSNPSSSLRTSQLILQPFRCFSYVIGNSPMSPGEPPMPHSPTLTSLHLRHSSFSNPSAALSTSQFILQPFRRFTYVKVILQLLRCFTYVTGTSRTSPSESPMHRGMKKQSG